MSNKRKLTSPKGEVFINTAYPILPAAEKAGMSLEYNCRDGHCGACLKTLVSGDVSYRNGKPMAFIPEGQILTCCSYAETDIEIE